MIPKLFALLCSAVLLAAFAACGPKPKAGTNPALLFQAEQKKKAIKTYTSLVDKYPESEYAAQAQARLSALGPLPAAAPAPKK